MHCSFSLLASSLLAFFLVNPVLSSVRQQIPEQWMKKRMDTNQMDAEKLVVKPFEKRDFVCYTDDYLEGLQSHSQDFTGFCSSFITEHDATSISDVTSTT